MSADLSSSSASAPPAPEAFTDSTIEVNDAVFCQHGKELCDACTFDGREENDAFFGFKPLERSPLELPDSTLDKEGKRKCKKHANGNCLQCFNWKKQLTKLHKDAKKGR